LLLYLYVSIVELAVLLLFIYFFVNTISLSSLGRSPWNFATWSKCALFYEPRLRIWGGLQQ